MKVFIIALLVAVCQANMFAHEQAALEDLAGFSIDKIVETIEQEINKLIHHELTPDEINVIHDLAEAFAQTVRNELSEAIAQIVKVGHLSGKFTERMMDKLKMAASEIADGLEMTPEMFKHFIENILKDIAHFEVGGVLHLDLDKMFHGVIDRALALVHHKVSQKRNLIDIWNKVNDTILRIVGHLHGKYHDLADFFKKTVKKAIDNIKPHIENIKALAKDFLDHVSTVRENVLRQAVEFFRPFASNLGDLWTKLLQKAHDRLEQLSNRTPATL